MESESTEEPVHFSEEKDQLGRTCFRRAEIRTDGQGRASVQQVFSSTGTLQLKPGLPTISWHSGDSLSVERAKERRNAINRAIRIAEKWEKERQALNDASPVRTRKKRTP